MQPNVTHEIAYQPDHDMGEITYRADGVKMFSQSVQFQNGPVADSGYNGVQNEDVLNLVAVRLRDLQTRFPCRENALAITKIEEAVMWLEHRTKLRVEQGVEGKNLAHVS